MSTQATRFTITMPAFLAGQINDLAKREHRSRSQIFQEMTRSFFGTQKEVVDNYPISKNIPNAETIAAFNEDPALATRYDTVDEMFNDVLGTDWNKN